MKLKAEEFYNLVNEVQGLQEGGLAYDYETTGLSVKRGARAFLLGFSHHRLGTHAVYINDISTQSVRDFLSNPRIKYAAHNAKFEMSFDRDQFGATVQQPWCTMVMDRVLYNNHRSYSLQNCAERRSWSGKYEPALEWLDLNFKQYHLMPEELAVPYVEFDASLSRRLMNDQILTFQSWDKSIHPIRNVVALEIKTTRHLFEMETNGLTVNVPYCKEALAYEEARILSSANRFRDATGETLVDSRKCLEPIFARLGLSFGRTEKGNASFDYEALRVHQDHEAVVAILDHRDATKRASSYWKNFIDAEVDGRIYPDIKQAGAATFRMSIVNPACQTWPRDDEDERDDSAFPVRRAFTASSPDHVIASLDWSQMELRKMADEAGEMEMIRAFQSGADFHQQTADLARVKRSIAKNGRFAKLYGAGIDRLALTLGVDRPTAKRVANAIDETSPRIAQYTRELINYAKQAPYSINWLGRRYFFDRGFEYKAANYRIQGGCTEILRIALDGIAKVLPARSRILLPYHDEFVLDLHRDDLFLLPKIKQIMIDAHQDKQFLEMDASCYVGPNFHDLEPYAI